MIRPNFELINLHWPFQLFVHSVIKVATDLWGSFRLRCVTTYSASLR